MEIEIVWTKIAKEGLDETIQYLEANWTVKEISLLETNINKFVEQVKMYPNIFPKSKCFKNLRKGLVDRNNYIVYQINKRQKQIVIINFRAMKQEELY